MQVAQTIAAVDGIIGIAAEGMTEVAVDADLGVDLVEVDTAAAGEIGFEIATNPTRSQHPLS